MQSVVGFHTSFLHACVFMRSFRTSFPYVVFMRFCFHAFFHACLFRAFLEMRFVFNASFFVYCDDL